jgi:MFS superfamily sulfate permease-like transporter
MMRSATAIPEAGGLAQPAGAARLRFDLTELCGSLGDLGTFLPLALAMTMTCGMNAGTIFILAGLMNIVSGWWFRQPIPVQPMKAIAAVAVAEGLTPGAIAAAGIAMGGTMLMLAAAGGVEWLARAVPRPVVRGIQVGIGLKLARQGLLWMQPLPASGYDSWVIAVLAGLAIATPMALRRRWPVLLWVFLSGFILLRLAHPQAWQGSGLEFPRLGWIHFNAGEWWIGVTRGAIPQLPLTFLNSVVAVCALSADYFPGRGVPAKHMAVNIGIMNLLCAPLGGMPMCHGSGGLAAQYRFGARTGGSVIMLGSLMAMAGLLLTGSLVPTLQQYPTSVLAVMVISAGLALAWGAGQLTQGKPLLIVVVMAAVIVRFNLLAGFATGCALMLALAGWNRRRVKA